MAGVVFSFLVLLLPFIFFFLYIKFLYPLQVLKRNGVVGPTASFFYGNYKDRVKVGLVKYLKGLHQEYGPIVGFYTGQIPQISVTDIELIKLITVKDFDSFIDKQPLPRLLVRKEYDSKGLNSLKGDVWRSTRKILSPTFSSFKLKAMTPIIEKSVESLVEVFEAQADTGKSFEIFRTYGAFTMEALFATSFGRVIEIQKGESNQLTEAAATIFKSAHEHKTSSDVFIMTILSNFPWLEPVLRFLFRGSMREKALIFLFNAATSMIRERRKENKPDKYKDFLQLMIDAEEEGDKDSQHSSGKKKLSDADIIGNSIVFMLAGYETTANALSYTSYLLAINPLEQEKLQEKIDAYYTENPDASLYQAAQNMEYLDMVLQESLRLFPPSPIYRRLCVKKYSYKGLTIPKNCFIHIPSILLQSDPEYWEDPEKFDPLRFTAEEKGKRPQQCHMPFGFGPRSCIGMRMALLESKMVLIGLLRRFTISKAPDTEVPLELTLGITMVPKNGIYLRVTDRT